MNLAIIVLLVIFILVFILRIPISLGMIAAGTYYFIVKGSSLSAVANHVMNTGKVTEKVFKFANGLVGGVRGALGHVNILASLIFSGMTGSAIADASGLGKMEIDAMKKAGYDDAFSCAITAASATIGPIFPPSIPLVMYAMLK